MARVLTMTVIAVLLIVPAQARRGWGACSWPAAHGGPCGCVAMAKVGLTDKRLWAVSEWHRFPKTEPHPGAAAIWRDQSHVEIVSRVYDDGYVDTEGSVGWKHVPWRRLQFVEPRPENYARGRRREPGDPFAFRAEAEPAVLVAETVGTCTPLPPPLPSPRPAVVEERRERVRLPWISEQRDEIPD